MTHHQQSEGSGLRRSEDARQARDPRASQTLEHWGYPALGTRGHRGEPAGDSRSQPHEDGQGSTSGGESHQDRQRGRDRPRPTQRLDNQPGNG